MCAWALWRDAIAWALLGVQEWRLASHWQGSPGSPSPAASGLSLLNTDACRDYGGVSPCFQDLCNFGWMATVLTVILGLYCDFEVWTGFRIASKWEQCDELSFKCQIINTEKVAFTGKNHWCAWDRLLTCYSLMQDYQSMHLISLSPHLRTNTFYLLFFKVLDFMKFGGGFRICHSEWTCVTPDTYKHRYNDCQCSNLCFQKWDFAAEMWVLWNLSALSPPFNTGWRHRELVMYARLCRKLVHEQGIISESMTF